MIFFSFVQNNDFPINQIHNKEIYFFNVIMNKHQVFSIFFIKQSKQLNIFKNRIKYLPIFHIDIYIIQYQYIKKTLYKVDINKLILIFHIPFIFKFKLVKNYILLNLII